ncbi:hypothetical protein DPEC_G00083630 [Dallia pectoralis]|uniref:Uncharacterized protein n=1 Tax=Dallia pectoralis TaxID=75939 RepID=A0ACC2GZH6_DALPE|nr:hypothetical protein DPEC_G00083630 [Dallia pectoralis]
MRAPLAASHMPPGTSRRRRPNMDSVSLCFSRTGSRPGTVSGRRRAYEFTGVTETRLKAGRAGKPRSTGPDPDGDGDPTLVES